MERRITFKNNQTLFIPKVHPLSFLSKYQLNVILKGKGPRTQLNLCPIYCRRCGGSFTKHSEDRFTCCNKKNPNIKCRNSCSYFDIKLYFIDLYDHNVISINQSGLPNPDHYLLTFNKNNQMEDLSIIFGSPNKNDSKKDGYKCPLLSNGTRLPLNISQLRDIFNCPYDYFEWSMENNNNPQQNPETSTLVRKRIREDNIDISLNAIKKKSKKNTEEISKSGNLDNDDFNDISNTDFPMTMKSIEFNDIYEIDKIKKEHLKFKGLINKIENKIFNIEEKIADIMVNVNSNRESFKSKIDNIKKKLDNYESIKLEKPKSKLPTEEKEKKIKNISKLQTKKNKSIIETINNLDKSSMPQPLKKITSKEKGLEIIKEGIVGLTTKTEKPISKDEVTLIYIEGIRRQQVGLTKNYLQKIGIKKYAIKNISFIGNNVCELLILKKFKNNIINTIKIFKNNFRVLENFNPYGYLNSSEFSIEEKAKVERAYFYRISDIINRRNCPEYLCDFFKEQLASSSFKYIDSNGEFLFKKSASEASTSNPTNEKFKGKKEENNERLNINIDEIETIPSSSSTLIFSNNNSYKNNPLNIPISEIIPEIENPNPIDNERTENKNKSYNNIITTITDDIIDSDDNDNIKINKTKIKPKLKFIPKSFEEKIINEINNISDVISENEELPDAMSILEEINNISSDISEDEGSIKELSDKIYSFDENELIQKTNLSDFNPSDNENI